MNEFKDLQDIWNQQIVEPCPADKITELAQKQKRHSTKKHIAGIAVMGTVSLLVLILWLLFAISPSIQLGLSLMFASIFTRTILEYYSFLRLKRIDTAEAPDSYQKKIQSFYRLRRSLMSFVTAIAVTLYSVGFVIMLPDFKANLPHWFYIYILAFLIVGIPLSAYLIYRQARKEFKDLSEVIEELGK